MFYLFRPPAAGSGTLAPGGDGSRGRISPVLPWIVGVALLMQSADGSILNNAIPSMAEALEVHPLQMQSAVVAYLLTSALFIPLSGWLADRFGVRRIFCLAIAVFSLGSAACALSASLTALVGARVIQGIGGALMVPVGRLAVVRIYGQSAELIRVLGFISIPAILGPVCGPLAGGFLVQYAAWPWIFMINIPIGVLAVWLSLKHVPVMKEESTGRFDCFGFLSFSAAVTVLSLWLTAAPSLNWAENLELPVLGGLLMAFYWMIPAARPGAIFDRSIFKKPGYLAGVLGNICSRTGSGAMPFLVPMYLQLGLGFTPIRTGVLLLAQAAGSILGKRLITSFLPRAGFKGFLQFNTLLLGLLVFSFSFLSPDRSDWCLILLLLVFGTVNSMQFTAMNTYMLIDLKHDEAGPGNSLLSVIMQLSSSSGVALAGAMMSLFAFLEMGGVYQPPIPARAVFEKTFFIIGLVILGASLIMSRLSEGSESILVQEIKSGLEN